MDASSNGRACGNCAVKAANACGSGSATESSASSGSGSMWIALACARAIMPAPITYILEDNELFPFFLFYSLASPIAHELPDQGGHNQPNIRLIIRWRGDPGIHAWGEAPLVSMRCGADLLPGAASWSGACTHLSLSF